MKRFGISGKRLLSALPFLLVPGVAQAAAGPTPAAIAADTIWTVVAAVLVMFMQAGFAFLEAGLTRAKSAGHIAVKNIVIFSIASLVFWAVGFAVCFGTGNAIFGTSGWGLAVSDKDINTVFFLPVVLGHSARR